MSTNTLVLSVIILLYVVGMSCTFISFFDNKISKIKNNKKIKKQPEQPNDSNNTNNNISYNTFENDKLFENEEDGGVIIID